MSNEIVSQVESAVIAKAKEMAINAVPTVFAPDPPPTIQAKPPIPMFQVPGMLNPAGAALANSVSKAGGSNTGNTGAASTNNSSASGSSGKEVPSKAQSKPESRSDTQEATNGSSDAVKLPESNSNTGQLPSASSGPRPQPAPTPNSAKPSLSEVQKVQGQGDGGLMCREGDAIVVGIDGTSSGSFRQNDPDYTPSSVDRLVRDYNASPRDKLYLDGPEAGSMLPYTWGETKQREDDAYRFVKQRLQERPDLKNYVDVYGHSRGGQVALNLGDRLGKDGIPVRHMGLYDPVDMDLGYPDPGISGNVHNATVVKAESPSFGDVECDLQNYPIACRPTYERSRDIFNRSDTSPVDPSKTHVEEKSIRVTHAGAGGQPWTGDHPVGHSRETDSAGSAEADRYVRDGAKKAGASIGP